MTVLLDTSLLISGYDPGDEPVTISVVSLGELRLGVLSAASPSVHDARLARMEAIATGVEVLPIGGDVAEAYGHLRHTSGREPANDLWIAATAHAHGLLLLTSDERQSKLPIRAQYIPGAYRKRGR